VVFTYSTAFTKVSIRLLEAAPRQVGYGTSPLQYRAVRLRQFLLEVLELLPGARLTRKCPVSMHFGRNLGQLELETAFTGRDELVDYFEHIEYSTRVTTH